MKFKKFLKKSERIEFTVEGKPPKKTSRESLWSKKSKQTKLIVNLREKAFEEYHNKGLAECFIGKIKFSLKVFAPNITKRKDSEDYVGDLDSLVAGVLDSLQPPPEHPDFEIDPVFLEKDKVGPDFPKIIEDDAQVLEVIAKKVSTKDTSGLTWYRVVIEPEK